MSTLPNAVAIRCNVHIEYSKCASPGLQLALTEGLNFYSCFILITLIELATCS